MTAPTGEIARPQEIPKPQEVGEKNQQIPRRFRKTKTRINSLSGSIKQAFTKATKEAPNIVFDAEQHELNQLSEELTKLNQDAAQALRLPNQDSEDSFDQLRRAYLETSDPDLKISIYSDITDHMMQSPSIEEATRQFWLEHLDINSVDDTEIDVMEQSFLPLLKDVSLNKRIPPYNRFALNEMQELVFEKLTQLIETDSPAITNWGRQVFIRALVVAYKDEAWTPLGEKAEEYFEERVEKWGLDERVLLRAWKRTSTSKNETEEPAITQKDFIVNNIMAMFALEKARPGICKTLFEEFRIADFERYPQEVLVAQYDNRDKDIPYGVIVVARGDNNGALSSENDYLRLMLYRDLAALGYGLRIYEADGRDALKRLQTAAKRYGSQNKISFVLIQQHGTEDAIGVDYASDQQDAIRTSHVHRALEHRDNRRIKEVRDWFVENPTLILDSCSTAPIGSMFKDFGFNIIAPQIPTKLNKLDVIQADTRGEIKFVGEYKDEGAAVHVANPHAK